MPTWMKCLEKKMNSADASTNVKLFILKLIINEPKARYFILFQVCYKLLRVKILLSVSLGHTSII